MASTNPTVKDLRFELINKGQEDVLIKSGFKWQLIPFKEISSYEIANAITVNPSTYRLTLLTDLENEDETLSYPEASSVIKSTQSILGTLLSRPRLDDHMSLLTKVTNLLSNFETKKIDLHDTISGIDKLLTVLINKNVKWASTYKTPKTEEEIENIFRNSTEFYNPSWTANKKLKDEYQETEHFKKLALLVEQLSHQATTQMLVDLVLGDDIQHVSLSYEGTHQIPVATLVLTKQMANYIRPKVEKRRIKFKTSKYTRAEEEENKLLIISLQSLIGNIDSFETNRDFIEMPQSPITTKDHSQTIPTEEVDDLFDDPASGVTTPNQKIGKTKSAIFSDTASSKSFSPEEDSPDKEVIGTSRRDLRLKEQNARDAQEKERKNEKLRKQFIDEDESLSGSINFEPNKISQIEIMLEEAFKSYKRYSSIQITKRPFPNHKTRFKSNKNYPTTLSKELIRDSDHIIPINESHRAIRYLVTINQDGTSPIFNKIEDHRWNRLS